MIHYSWIIAGTGTLVLVLSLGFGRMSFSVILPSMKEGLSLTYTQIGLIGTGNFIGYLFLAVIGGIFATRFGVRRVVFVSLLIMGIALFLTGLSESYGFAFFMRLITGMGNGGSCVPMMALPAAWFAAGKRGLATGIVTVGTGMGLSMAGLILPCFVSTQSGDGWRYAWYVMGIIVFACSFVCYAFLRDHPSEKGLTMYGGNEQAGAAGQQVTFFSALSRVAKEREIWKLGCVYFMTGFSYIIYVTFIIAYLIKEVGLTPGAAGEVFAMIGFAAIFCGIVWGGISDSIGRRNASVLAYILAAISCVLPFLWKTPAGYYCSAALFGMTAFALPVIMAAASGDAVGGKLAPAAFGFITLFFGVGQALGPALAGWIKDATGTFANAFILSACVFVIGAATSLMLKKKVALPRGGDTVLLPAEATVRIDETEE